jgi:uncharacterized membrane protein
MMSIKNRDAPWSVWVLLLLVTLLAMGQMIWLAVTRYLGHNTLSFDLGVMSQAIWSATQGQPLIFTAEGVSLSRLARHVEIFYFLLAPLYWLRPSPTTLIIAQACLYAAGAIPAFRMAWRHWQHPWLALAAPVIYLFYPVAQTAVLFEFHGDTLAMPLLLFALEALDRRAWRTYALWLALALSCKFYVAVAVAGLGLLLWLQGERRVGSYTLFAAVIWGGLAFFGIRALFAPAEAALVKATPASYLTYYFGQVEEIAHSLLPRLVITLLVYLPALATLNRRNLGWLLPATLIAAPVLLSTGPGPSYDYRFHHYALAVPFLVTAVIHGGAHLRQMQPPGRSRGLAFPWQLRLLVALLLTLGLNALFVDTPLNPQFYSRSPGSGMGFTESGFTVSSRDQFKDKWLADSVPSTGAVLTNKQLGLRLVNRETIFVASLLPENRWATVLDQTDYAVFDVLYDFALADANGQIYHGGVTDNHAAIRAVMTSGQFQLLASQDGLLLFGREGAALEQRAEVVTFQPPSRISPVAFSEQITLLAANVIARSGRQFEATFVWQAQQPLPYDYPLIAVSKIEGLNHARLVHLPTLFVLPTTEWEAGMIIRETFVFELPQGTPPGAYQLSTGWHDSTHLFAHFTDPRSVVGIRLPTSSISFNQ